MGDTNVTLLEIHIDGEPVFSPPALPSLRRRSADDETQSAPETAVEERVDAEASDSDGGRSMVGFAVVLGLLVGLALAIRKYRSDDEPVEQPDEPDVIVS